MIFQKIYKDEDLLALDYIKPLNLVVLGAGDGKLRLVDLDKIKKAVASGSTPDKPGEDPAMLLSDMDSDIRAVDVSPDGKICAVGTSKGTIKLFKTAYIKEDFEFAVFSHHTDEVWNIKFMDKGDDQLMISIGKDEHLRVTSIKEGKEIFSLHLDEKLRSLVINEATSTILTNSHLTNKCFKINISNSISADKSNNIIDAIKATFLFSKDAHIKEACIHHISDDAFIFQKINLSTFSAFMSDSLGLKIAIDHGYEPLIGIDGRSLLDMCQEKNDSESIDIILSFINRKGRKLDLNMFLYCLEKSTPQSKVLMAESLFRDSQYDSKIELPIKGEIK